LIGATAIEDKL